MSTDLVERESGLVVPAAVADAAPDGITRDKDGRRRVVVPSADLKKIRRAAEILNARGFQMFLRCDDSPTAPGTPTTFKGCGITLSPEDSGGADPGMGCGCSRIHFGR